MSRLEHDHVISLTHVGTDAFVICACGTGSTVMPVEHTGKWIANHRLDNFWLVKYRWDKYVGMGVEALRQSMGVDPVPQVS